VFRNDVDTHWEALINWTVRRRCFVCCAVVLCSECRCSSALEVLPPIEHSTTVLLQSKLNYPHVA